MNGTEKQIKWATDILAKCELSAQEFQGKTSEENYKWIMSMVDRIKSIDSAALIISGGLGNTSNGIIPQNSYEWRTVFTARKIGEDIIVK